MPILKIEKLTKKYGKTYALNGLDMEVKKGDIYGFVGPNGAGKTTTLRIISGLLKSDGGDLWLDGVRTTKNILKQKSLIGFVPDFFGVYENLSVIEYLEFFAASYGIYGRAGTVRAREVLEMVELSGKEEQLVDSRENSEWFWKVDITGKPVKKLTIVDPWKCPYHNGRMCMEIIRRNPDVSC